MAPTSFRPRSEVEEPIYKNGPFTATVAALQQWRHPMTMKTNEEIRLEENARREKNWERWGPYLSERQWATVRED